MQRLRRTLLLPALLACPTAAAAFGPTSSDEARTRDEIDFATGLANDFGFIDLAAGVLDDLEQGGDVPSSLTESLSLARCEVFAVGAKNEPRMANREALYDQAILAYEQFLDQHEFGDAAEAAERAYIDISNAYGVHMVRLLEDAIGDEADRIRTRIGEVLLEAIERSTDLVEKMEREPDPTDLQKRELYKLMFNLGQLRLTAGRVSEIGEAHFREGERILGDLASQAGEQSAFGLYAYWLTGQIYLEEGNRGDDEKFEYAYDYLEFVVNEAIPREPERWEAFVDPNEGFTKEQLQARWDIAEYAMAPLLKATRSMGTDDSAQVGAEWALYFFNRWKSQGFNLGPHGYLGLLDAARSILDAGGSVGGRLNSGELQWFSTVAEREAAGFKRRNQSHSPSDLALAMADTVNRDNRGTTLQIRAQQLVSEIISRPGVVVDPEILYEAAQGEYNARNYEAAAGAFRRVLAALESETDAARREYGAKTLWHLGQSYKKQNRHLEAAVAFEEGLSDRYKGDPEFDPENAKAFQAAAKAFKASGPTDPRIDEMVHAAEQTVLQVVDQGAGDIKYELARRKWSDKEFSEARVGFLDVDAGALNFEKAKVYAAAAAYRMKDNATASSELDGYLTDYLEDPLNATNEENRLLKRREAEAMAVYYLARIHFEDGDYAKAIELASGYSDRFPSQQSYGPFAHQIAALASLKNDDMDAARAEYAVMVERFPAHAATGKVSVRVYKDLEARREAAVEAGDEAASRDLLERMADTMHISNQAASKPAYGNLRAEARHWIELDESEKAEPVLRRILADFERGAFGDDPKLARQMDRLVRPDLAHVLVEQRRLQEALELLDPLVPRPDDEDADKPSQQTVIDYCRAVSGWVRGDASTFEEVPGVGDAAAFEVAAYWWNKLGNSATKWECEWYGHKFGLAYTYYRWSELDSSKKASAERQLAFLVDQLGPDFAKVAESCGDAVWQNRLRELWKLVH